jgi:hypothetical protein
VYFAATAVYLSPILGVLTSRVALFSGDSVLNAYLLAWNQHGLLTQPQRLFSGNFLYPSDHTLALSDTLLVPALLTLPLAPFQNPVLVYNVLFFASFFLSALLWFAVLRVWGLAPIAAVAGGWAFGFLPWRLGQVGHVQLLYTWWIPVAVGCAMAWVRSGGWWPALGLGLSVGAQFYTGVYNTWFLLLYLVVFVGVGLVGGRPVAADLWRRVGQAAAAAAVVAVIVAPALPAYLDMKRTLGRPNSLETIALRGAAIGDYLRPSSLSYLWGRIGLARPNGYSDVPWEHELFLGFGAMVLAVSAVGALWRARRATDGQGPRLEREVAMLAAAGVASLVISLGPVLHWGERATSIRLPYGFLYDLVPGFDSMRVPSRAALFVGLSVSGMAAVALHHWWTMPAGWRRLSGRVAAVGGIGALALEAWAHPLPYEANGDYQRHVRAEQAIAALGPGVVLVLPLEWKLNYLAPLTTWPHFYPLVNGVSGHMPPANRRILDTLSAPEWGADQAELLRVLDVRYLVVDHMNTGAPMPSDKALRRFLDTHGFSTERVWSHRDGISVLVIRSRAGAADLVPGAAPGAFEYSHTVDRGRGRLEVFLWVRRTAGPVLTAREGRQMSVQVDGYDREGRRMPDMDAAVRAVAARRLASGSGRGCSGGCAATASRGHCSCRGPRGAAVVRPGAPPHDRPE